jgi:Rieske Fe-S protein
LILGRENPWAPVYDPARVRAKSLGEYVKDAAQMASQYAAWITPGEVESAEDIAPGEGAIIRRGLHKVAVHRTQEGQVIQCSAVCPHLDCVVAWNSAEQTWDCPCHGSRFTAEGKVFNGPANSDLKRLDSEEN